MTEKRYKIGQVLFVIPSNGKANVVPVQVVEEITKKSIDGEATTYMIRNRSGAVPIPLSQCGGEVFESSSSVKESLHLRSAKVINTIVDRAVNSALEQFPDAFEEQPSPPSVTVEQPDDSFVVLDDGTKARLKMSTN